jgi:hypothetical protein
MVFAGGALLATIGLCSITPTRIIMFSRSNALLAGSGLGGVFPRLADRIFAGIFASTAIFITAGLAAARALMATLYRHHTCSMTSLAYLPYQEPQRPSRVHSRSASLPLS